MEVVGDILPPGTLNIVNRPGAEVGMALARPCALAGDDQSHDHLL
jgi:acyl-CoA reductase-like NAD-dependent aldehyde dehydrogenase